MIDFLAENQIHLFCLPPHTTNILQPLDAAILRPLKTYISRITDMVKLASLGSKQPVNICEKNFTAMFKEAYERGLSAATVRQGFWKCGILPFNPDAIDKKRGMPSNFSNTNQELSVDMTITSSTPLQSSEVNLFVTPSPTESSKPVE